MAHQMIKIEATAPQGQMQFLRPNERIFLAISRYESRRNFWSRAKYKILSSLEAFREVIFGKALVVFYRQLLIQRKLNETPSYHIVKVKAKLKESNTIKPPISAKTTVTAEDKLIEVFERLYIAEKALGEQTGIGLMDYSEECPKRDAMTLLKQLRKEAK